MLYCQEIVKQNGEYQFKKDGSMPRGELKNTINHLFSGYRSGIRAVILCTPCPDEVPGEEEFRNQLSTGGRTAVILGQGGAIPAEAVGCARLGPFGCLGQALNELLGRVGKSIGEDYINQDAKRAAAIYCNYDGFTDKVDSTVQWNKHISNRASKVLHTDKMKRELDRVPNICVLLVLPEHLFDTFSQKDCYFPLFIEYVVHAVNVEQACRTLQTRVEEQSKQLEEKDRIIKEQGRIIGEGNNRRASLQPGIDESSTVPDTTRSASEDLPIGPAAAGQ